MLALGIRYLTGSVAASDVANRNRLEWPPHPARVFIAMAAAHFQTGEDNDERQALEWLERLEPPLIAAGNCAERSVVEHHVPVNDHNKQVFKKDGKWRLFQEISNAVTLRRERQPRTFSRGWLEDDTVHLVWPTAEPERVLREALARLCGKVTRIGHSSSLVQMWLCEDAPHRKSDWRPDDLEATVRCRVAGKGTLRFLEREFNARAIGEYEAVTAQAADASDRNQQREARRVLRDKFHNQPPQSFRPNLALWQGYAPVHQESAALVAGTVFDTRMIVFQLAARESTFSRLDLTTTLQVTGRLREALLDVAGKTLDSIPEVISGHTPDGSRSERPHLAFLPCAFVGHEHADGRLMGVAVAIPVNEISREDRMAVLRSLAAVSALKLGPLGVWELRRIDLQRPAISLRAATWTAAPNGATHWGSVTPVALDRHAKAKDKAAYQRETTESIAESCERIGLPRPGHVIATPVSAHLGAPAAHEFPRLQRKDGSECRHTHAILCFDRPVVGPVLLGAGRYRGYGMFRPLE